MAVPFRRWGEVKAMPLNKKRTFFFRRRGGRGPVKALMAPKRKVKTILTGRDKVNEKGLGKTKILQIHLEEGYGEKEND